MSLFSEVNKTVPDLKDIGRERKIREQLHVSGINMMNTCGQQFFFRYILGMKRPPNAFLYKGSSLDKSVTKDLDNVITTGELLSVNDCKEIAAVTFDELQQKDPIELEAHEKEDGRSLADVIGEAKDDAVLMAEKHRLSAAPVIRPYRVARRFSISLDKFFRQRARELREQRETLDSKYSRRVLDSIATSLNAAARDGMDFVGEQDIVEQYTAEPSLYETVANEALGTQPAEREVLVIRDTKSSGKSPNENAAHDSEQLSAYAAAAYVVDGRLPDEVALDFIVLTPKKKETKYVPVRSTRDLDDVNSFLNRVVNTVHAIRSGMFVPTRPDDWHCTPKFCGYHDICPYARKPKTTSK